MNKIFLLLSITILIASLLAGCAGGEANPPAPDASLVPQTEANQQNVRDAEINMAMTQIPNMGTNFNASDYVAVIKHYQYNMKWNELEQVENWEYCNRSDEGPFYVVIPQSIHSTVTVEATENNNGVFVPTHELYRKEAPTQSYALVVSTPLVEGAESLRVTVQNGDETTSFDFYYAPVFEAFPILENGFLHTSASSVFDPTNEFGEANERRTNGYDSDPFGQTNEFGGGNTGRTDQYDPDVFGETNAFGDSSEGSIGLNPDLFGQTNEFGGAGSPTSGNTAASKQLATRYETEADLPPATAQEQSLIDTYLNPYDASGLYRINFTPDYMNEMSDFTLTILFDSLCREFGGYPTQQEILPGGRVAGDVFEGKLMKHLPLTKQMIRSISDSYDPSDGTYELNPGIGSAPAYYVITEYIEHGTALRISYAHYGLASNATYTAQYIKLYGTGTTVINRMGDSYSILGNIYEEV